MQHVYVQVNKLYTNIIFSAGLIVLCILQRLFFSFFRPIFDRFKIIFFCLGDSHRLQGDKKNNSEKLFRRLVQQHVLISVEVLPWASLFTLCDWKILKNTS